MKLHLLELFFIFTLTSFNCLFAGGDLPVIIKNASSNLCNDGKLEVSPINGVPPFIYKWYIQSNPSQILSTTNILDQIFPGAYCVEVEDLYGGEVCACFNVGIDNNILLVKELKYNSECYVKNNGQCNSSCDGAIEIDVNYNGNYIIHWSNGSTNKRIENLCFGDYSVQVINDQNCVIGSLDFSMCCCTVTDGHPSGNSCFKCNPTGILRPISVSAKIINESFLNAKNGSIQTTINGGLNKKYYYWTGPRGFKSNEKDIYSLSSGVYCLDINDGCNNYHNCFEVKACDPNEFNILNSTLIIKNPCPNKSNGFIFFGNLNFNYLWDNGSINSFRNYLQAGSYTVTITNPVNLCELIKTIEIKEAKPAKITKEEIIPACNSTDNGELIVFLDPGTGDNSKFEYWWEDLNIKNNNYNASRDKLKKGLYTIHVKDACGEITKTYSIEQSSISDELFSTTWKCENNILKGDIDTRFYGPNIPLKYNWSNGATTDDIFNVQMGKYTVTVTDNKGCKIIKEIELDPISEVQISPPCSDLKNGSLFIYIKNPGTVSVKYSYWIFDSWDTPQTKLDNSTNSEIKLYFYGLDNQDIKLIFDFDGCLVERVFKIGKQKFNGKFLSFDDINGDCKYDLYCGNEFIKDNTFTEKPKLIAKPCINEKCPSLELYCNANLVKTIEGKKKSMRKEKARALAYSLGYGDVFENKYSWVSPCGYIDVCITNPLCGYDGIVSKGNLSKGGDYVDGYWDGPCYKVICKWAFIFNTGYSICDLNYIPGDLSKYFKPSDSWVKINSKDNNNDGSKYICKEFRTEHWEVIRKNLSFYEQKYSKKIVDQFLQDCFTHGLSGWNIDDPKHFCTEVNYCLDNFKFQSLINNNQNCGNNMPVDCRVKLRESDFEFWTVCQKIVVNGRTFILCDYDPKNASGGCPGDPEVKEIPSGPKTPFTKTNDIDLQSFILPYSLRNKHFEKLSYYFSEDSLMYAEGIISKNGIGNVLLEHPLTSHIVQGFDDSININNAYFEPRLGISSFTFLTDNKKRLKFYTGNEDELSFFDFYGDNEITYHNLRRSTNGFTLPISYLGNIYMDDSLISNSLESGFALASYSMNNNSFSFNNFDNVYYFQSKGLSNQFDLIKAKNPANPIIFNNVSYSSNSGKLICLNYKDLTFIGTDIDLKTEYKVTDYASIGDTLYTVLLGSGNLTLGGSSIQTIFDSSLIVVKTFNGVSSIIKEINSKLIIPNSINIECDFRNKILLGYSKMSLNNDSSLLDTSFILNSNIYFCNLSLNGEIIKEYEFGSLNNEIIKDMILTKEGLVYFGGDIYGDHAISTLGNVEFLRILDTEFDPFLSYFLLNENSSNVITRNLIKNQNSKNKFSIYPSPFDDFINIKAESQQYKNVVVSIYNSFGYEILRKTVNEIGIYYPLKIELSNLRTGIYIVKIENEFETLYLDKIMKYSDY